MKLHDINITPLNVLTLIINLFNIIYKIPILSNLNSQVRGWNYFNI